MSEWHPAARIAVAVAIVAVLAYIALVAAVFAGQRMLIYPRWSVPDLSDEYGNLGRVEIRTADGETLKGYWRPPTGPAGVVVTFHGNASAPEPQAFHFGNGPWQRNGWGYLAIAYRGYPGSTGSPSESGLLADGEAATEFVRQHAPDAPILFHGHSLGSAVAVAMASLHPSKGLYLEAPLPSMTAMAIKAFPFLPSMLLRDTYRSDERIEHVTAPVFAVHGIEDPVIPAAYGEALIDHVRSSPRTFKLIHGDHVDVLGAEDVVAEAFFRDRPVVYPR